MKKKILTLYLRMDSSAKSLTKRALAQLILKIIYSLEKSATRERIILDVSDIINAQISAERIDEGIESLIRDRKIENINGVFHIDSTKLAEIDTAYNEYGERIKRVIKNYFSNTETSIQIIQIWFENVSLAIFEAYSNEWISDLCKITDGSLKERKDGIIDIVQAQTQKTYNLNPADKEWLIKQYIKFLESDTDPDVVAILWDYGTSCFSSTLLTANVAADPISVDEFKDSICILDTNVLMYLDLEAGDYKKSFAALENIFDSLNIKPIYFSITRDEFTRSMEFKKENVIRVVENYSGEVISEVKDPFLETAIKRGCTEEGDFVRFFDELLDVPKYFSDHLEISNRITKEVDAAIEKGQKDEDLKGRINDSYFKKRGRDKRKNAILHDAGLISGATFMRSIKEKCFILSRDRILNEVALDLPIRNEAPIAISLDTLINLFAVDNGGTGIDATNYAPLFANIVKLELVPEKQVFKVEDLSWLLDIQNQIADLPTDNIIDLAKQIHKSQRNGTKDEEIALDINRSFQRVKLSIVDDLDKARKTTFLEKTEKEKYIKQSNKTTEVLRETYRTELLKKYGNSLVVNRVLCFVVFPLLMLGIIGGIIYQADKNHKNLWIYEGINLGLHIVAWFIVDFFFIKNFLNRNYAAKVANIDKEVEDRIRKDLTDDSLIK